MKFSQMAYHRPDDEAMERRYGEMARQLAACGSAQEALALVDEHEKIRSEYETMGSLSYIRHSINTTDPFYEKEMAYFDERGPVFEEAQKGFLRALANSSWREEVEKTTGELFFRNIDIALKTSSEEIIPLCQRENEVCTAYEKLLASARIPFDGEERNLAEMRAYQVSDKREIRREAWEKTAEFFQEHAATLDEMFDELVKNRTEQARKLGYENYVQLGYDRLGRNCYSPAEVRAFREQIARDAVPAAMRVKQAQARRLGIERTMYYDNDNAFPDGNPRPAGGEAELRAAARRMYHEMGEETGRFFDTMEENELFDLKSRKGKQTGGYCTSLSDYGCPFIFANFNGTEGDVSVFTHEGGHALAFYLARNLRFKELDTPTMEACETHSMSMELFSSRWAESFFGPDTKKFLRYQLEDILNFLPYGCMVDEFQEGVYEHPEWTPAQRKASWAELEKKYRPWLCFTGVPFFEDGGYQRQHHIYSSPLYYIDYCLAQTTALQFWMASLSDWQGTFENYLRFTHKAGTRTFVELLKESGLPSPFEEGSVGAVCRKAEQWLDGLEA